MVPKKLKSHRSMPSVPVAVRCAKKPSAHRRGYDAAWRKLRMQVLLAEPLCRKCGKPAEDVDHIKTIRSGGARLDPKNLQPLCHSCHARKSNTTDIGRIG